MQEAALKKLATLSTDPKNIQIIVTTGITADLINKIKKPSTMVIEESILIILENLSTLPKQLEIIANANIDSVLTNLIHRPATDQISKSARNLLEKIWPHQNLHTKNS